MMLLREGATVLALSFAGRALGLARTVVAASWLGAGPSADAFFVAFRLFGLLRAVLAGGGLSAAFVPLFSRRLARDGPDAARAFAGDAFASLGAVLAAVTALAAIAMAWMVAAAAPGFAGDPGRLELAAALAHLMLPCLLLGGLALVLRAVLNGLDRFAAGAAMPALFNLAAMAGLLALEPVLPSAAHALAAGVAAAGAVQLAVLVLACRRARFALPLAPPCFDPEVRRLFRRAVPAALAVGAMQATLLVDAGVASLLPPGAVSHLDYAVRVTGLVPALVGGAAATVLLPLLSRADGRGVANATNRALEAVLLLGVPGAAALAVLSTTVAAALFHHGAFTAADASATARAIAAYALGLPAWLVTATLAPAFFARGDTATPLGAALAGVAANLGLSLLLAGPYGHTGIALATAVSAWLQGAVLAALLTRRGWFAPDRRLARKTPAIAAASGAMAGVLWLAESALGAGAEAGAVERAAVLAALVAGGLAAFALFAVLTGAAAPREIARAWRHELE